MFTEAWNNQQKKFYQRLFEFNTPPEAMEADASYSGSLDIEEREHRLSKNIEDHTSFLSIFVIPFTSTWGWPPEHKTAFRRLNIDVTMMNWVKALWMVECKKKKSSKKSTKKSAKKPHTGVNDETFLEDLKKLFGIAVSADIYDSAANEADDELCAEINLEAFKLYQERMSFSSLLNLADQSLYYKRAIEILVYLEVAEKSDVNFLCNISEFMVSRGRVITESVSKEGGSDEEIAERLLGEWAIVIGERSKKDKFKIFATLFKANFLKQIAFRRELETRFKDAKPAEVIASDIQKEYEVYRKVAQKFFIPVDISPVKPPIKVEAATPILEAESPPFDDESVAMPSVPPSGDEIPGGEREHKGPVKVLVVSCAKMVNIIDPDSCKRTVKRARVAPEIARAVREKAHRSFYFEEIDDGYNSDPDIAMSTSGNLIPLGPKLAFAKLTDEVVAQLRALDNGGDRILEAVKAKIRGDEKEIEDRSIVVRVDGDHRIYAAREGYKGAQGAMAYVFNTFNGHKGSGKARANVHKPRGHR